MCVGGGGGGGIGEWISNVMWYRYYSYTVCTVRYGGMSHYLTALPLTYNMWLTIADDSECNDVSPLVFREHSDEGDIEDDPLHQHPHEGD